MTSHRLLELQQTDSHIDLLRNRLPKLPEVVAAAQAAAEVKAWEQRAAELRTRIAELEASITASEQANATIGTKRARLEQQLKTVIAPREAEALMHEISLLNTQRSALDDEELAAMDLLAEAEDALTEHNSNEAAVREKAAAAEEVASAARGVSEADIVASSATRDSLRASLDEAIVKQYDTMRGQHSGVAIAKLNGMQCDGCHLDLSRAEVDDIKRLPDDEMGECPNCGRLLVR
jgi:predicted  nucleic acid-binding Zn-ribbon protein